ncbi:single-stranded-DNA-specific exonuclease RecJ [Salinicoccus sp. HZC-1]|uniref:single-stranded-DNA-specific exonuclease RecJ n=1 Tax=Salinicoccus sp. HZC-1 TaxID=3385497 RepID=UPI00398AE781
MYQSKYEWKVRKKTADIEDDTVKAFGLNNLEKTVLENRGFVADGDLNKIFKPKSYEASLIQNIGQAVERIETAINNNENILIYGDFDADGITSTVLLSNALKRSTQNVEFIIPDRITDGYGPNRAIFEEVVVGQFDLVITVDNGISSQQEISFLEENDVDTIVVDHHSFGENVPETTIIHPDHPEGTYPYNALAGVGITYKLVQALGLDRQEDLALVAIGTVADLVPIIDENKKLVIDGLEVLNDRPTLGIKSLLRSAGHDGIIDEETIGFTIAPRLNATGRLGEASVAVELLLEEDADSAYELSMAVERMNQERKQIVEEIHAEAAEMVDGSSQINIVYKEGWHPGVIGIVASRLVDQFGKPAIVLTLDGEAYRGSARSIEGVDLHGVIGEQSSYHSSYGGHSQALGIEVPDKHIESFKDELTQYFESLGLDLRPVKYIDYQLKPGNMTMKEFERFERLKPFGQSFNTPIFMVNNAKIGAIRQVGKDKSHVKITIPELELDVIGFRFGHLIHEVGNGDTVSLIGTVNINEFNQKRSLQMVLLDASIDTVQIMDMRSKTDQQFDIITKDDVFLIQEGKEKKGPNYYHYGERLPFVTESVVLRDLPDSLDNLTYSLNNIHVSKVIMIFHSKTELFFTGLPNRMDIEKLQNVIVGAEDGSINMAKHAPALSKKIGVTMTFLKMTTDIMEDLKIIELKNGIVYKVNVDYEWNLNESTKFRLLNSRMEAETRLKMSSTNELKQYVRTLISN